MDPEWLGRLLDQYASALSLYARQWCDVPEDVVQDAFLKLSAQASQPRNPGAWLFRVVRNASIDAGQRARRRRRHERQAASFSRDWFVVDEPRGAGDIDPDDVTAELQRLPIEEREIIIAFLWGGLTFEQIAEAVGCSSSTAHRIYVRGLSTLRERLGVTWPRSRQIPI